MDTEKGVRRYGRLRQGLQWSRYILHRCLLLPLRWAVCFLYLSALLGFLFAGFRLLSLLSGDLLGPSFSVDPVSSLALAFLACFILAFRAGWFLRYSNFDAPEGTLLNPRPPLANPVLPDADLLVRASSPSATQPAELLRAAKETMEQKPEELLRAME